MILIRNRKMLVHVMEPLGAVSAVLGLNGYRFIGERMMALSVFSMIQYYAYFTITWISQLFFISTYEVKPNAFAIFYLVVVVTVLSGITNITWFWLSNVKNSKTIIKIFCIFDSVEFTIPKCNGFAHNTNNFNRFLHLMDIFLKVFICASLSKSYMQLAIYLLCCVYCITTNFIFYQFCNLMFMTCSYAHMLNVILWENCEKSRPNSKFNNALMDLLKNKIIRCTVVDCSNEKIFSRIDLISVQKIYDSLMDIVELINQKFGIAVRIFIE